MVTAGQRLVLVSACLAGLRTRYDGRVIDDPVCRKVLKSCIWIPVCPEQLGGLPTPRCPAEIAGGNGNDVLGGRSKVIGSDGANVTEEFIRGAKMVLEIATRLRIEECLLKARSPSCGVEKLGVTAALLKENGIRVTEYG